MAGAVLWLLIPSRIQTMEKSAVNAQILPRTATGGIFLFAVGLLVLAVMLYYGARKWYAIPLAMMGIVYCVFRVLLHVPLPRSERKPLMEQFLGGLGILMQRQNPSGACHRHCRGGHSGPDLRASFSASP